MDQRQQMSAEVDQLMGALPLDQKIGQILIFGWRGATEEENTTVSAHARTLIDELQVGGVILLGRNIGTPERTARTMNELQSRSKTPLFIVADQEGGMVARFQDPFVVFPSNMALGATANPEYAYRAARATAQQLRAAGVNFNFAPCVDVNNNPLNPIIGSRSYGDNADLVSRFAVEAIRGYRDGGVLTSAKHFPGHGDTSVDSHLALPVVDFPLDRLEAVELPPFRAAISAGVDSIMTTHIVFPALDPEMPATLSERIISGLLREEMGFDGLVVTDSLEMKGVSAKWGTPGAAVRAFKAGADGLLICHTVSEERAAHRALLEAVQSGEISTQRLDQSVRRILQAKARLGILGGAQRADPAQALGIASSDSNKSLALEIARRAVTVVRNDGGVLPARAAEGDHVVVVSMHPALQRLVESFKLVHPNTKGLAVDAEDARARRILVPADTRLIVAATCRSEPWTAGMDEEAQASLVRFLDGLGLPLVVIALREPYDIRRFPEIRTYMAIYGYGPESLQAAAEVILGKAAPYGTLPVALDNG